MQIICKQSYITPWLANICIASIRCTWSERSLYLKKKLVFCCYTVEKQTFLADPYTLEYGVCKI